MRLIEQQMCNAITKKQSMCKDNTTVSYNNQTDTSHVHLHGNLIAVVGTNYVEVYDGGYQSKTTKSRLNALINGLCNGYACGVYQRKFEWFIMDNDETDIEFQNGYTFERV